MCHRIVRLSKHTPRHNPTALALAALGVAACGETIVIAPEASQVPTCGQRAFTATPSDGVTWSVTGGGTMMGATYHAPIAVPTPPSARVTAARDSASGEATIALATTFPGPLTALAAEDATARPDLVHGVAARGDRVYVISESNHTPFTVSLASSRDGGRTFGAPVQVASHAGPAPLYATAVAMDAADPDVVHLTLYVRAGGGTVDSLAAVGTSEAGSLLLLATSRDGGASFTLRPLYSGGNGDAQNADVISPSAGSVVITAPTAWVDTTSGAQGAMLLVWHDPADGLVALDNGYDARWAAGQALRLPDGQLIETADGARGPRLAAAMGRVCVTFGRYGINGGPHSAQVVCSDDGGATLGGAVTAVVGEAYAITRPTLAVSARGTRWVVGYEGHDSAVDAIGTSRFVVSDDGARTFGSPVTLSTELGGDGVVRAVSETEVFVDGADTVWIARTVDGERVALDKSCDGGATLSGAVSLGDAAVSVPLFYETTAGLFAGGWLQRGEGSVLASAPLTR